MVRELMGSRLRMFLLKKEQTVAVATGGRTGVDLSLWNDKALLVIRKVEVLRRTSHFGFLLGFGVESMRATIHVALAPVKCSSEDGSISFLDESDVESGSSEREARCSTTEPLSFGENHQEQVIIASDGQSATIRMSINGCLTTKLKSPLRVLLYLVGLTPEADRTAISHPISVFHSYHKATERLFPQIGRAHV